MFRAVQDHAVDAARAHLATVVLEAFNEAVEQWGQDARAARTSLRMPRSQRSGCAAFSAM